MKMSYILLLGFIFLVGGLLYFLDLGNSKLDALIKMSYSIDESKKEKAFVGFYNVVTIDSSIVDYLNRNELDYIKLDSIDYWVENEYNYFYKFIFFKKHVYSDELRLLIENPTSNLNKNGRYPYVEFKIKGTDLDSRYSGQGMGGQVCVIKIGLTVREESDLEVYLYYGNGKSGLHIGDVKIRLDTND